MMFRRSERKRNRAFSPTPVSYTHLDVYKRQPQALTAGRWLMPVFTFLLMSFAYHSDICLLYTANRFPDILPVRDFCPVLQYLVPVLVKRHKAVDGQALRHKLCKDVYKRQFITCCVTSNTAIVILNVFVINMKIGRAHV